MDKPVRMLLVEEVADLLRVSQSTVYRAIREGDLVAARVGRGSGAIRIPESAYDAYLARCQQAAAQPERLLMNDPVTDTATN